MSSFRQSQCHFIHIFLFMLTFVSKSQTQPLKNSFLLFRSVYTFGDSFVDPGNNNYIRTTVRSNFPPYGRDFVRHVPTGRFSNGRLFPDFLAYYLGVINYQRPYLDPKLKLEDSLTAVSFGSGTSGYDPITATLNNVISMSQQLEYFKQYKMKLEKRIGKKKAKAQISNAVFYMNAGSGDFAFTFLGEGKGGYRNGTLLPDYEQFLLQLIQQFVQGLYDQGARRIAVNGLPPLGCLPVAITELQGLSPSTSPERNCLDQFNNLTNGFNLLLQDKLKTLQMNLSKSGAKIAYIDFEKPLLNIIQNPGTYGFTKVNVGCCGTGLYEIGPPCNQTVPVCSDASQYVFWDATHPTEKAYWIIFKDNLATINQLIRG